MHKLCSLFTVLCSLYPPPPPLIRTYSVRVAKRKLSLVAGLIAIAFTLSLVNCVDLNDTGPTLTEADFRIAYGKSNVYDGSPKSVIVKCNRLYEGTITVYYEGTGATAYDKTTAAPSSSGTYAVIIDATENRNWKAVNGLYVGTMTITPANQAAKDYDVSNLRQIYDGNPKAVTITPKTGNPSSGAITVYYEGTGDITYSKSIFPPSGYGKYAVTFDVAATENYKAASGFSAGTLYIIVCDGMFTNIGDLDTWLSTRSGNTIDTPYIVVLDVNSLGNFPNSLVDVLIANNAKYLNLDLSGSTFTSISIGGSISSFSSCSSLISITIPDSVRYISNISGPLGITFPIFGNCVNLVSIYVGAENKDFSSHDGILYNKNKMVLVTYPAGKKAASFTIPDGVRGIENRAFYGCASLASVTIPNRVISIGVEAFYGCASLTGITIPDGVTSIGNLAFSGCTSLASVTFEGTIASSRFNSAAFSNIGDLRAKFYATDATNGTPGTYTTTAPVGNSSVWTRTN